VDRQRDGVVTGMREGLVDGHGDRLARAEGRHDPGRRPTAFVTTGSELLGTAEDVLRHPGVGGDEDEVGVGGRAAEHGGHGDAENAPARLPAGSEYARNHSTAGRRNGLYHGLSSGKATVTPNRTVV